MSDNIITHAKKRLVLFCYFIPLIDVSNSHNLMIDTAHSESSREFHCTNPPIYMNYIVMLSDLLDKSGFTIPAFSFCLIILKTMLPM